ncbi:F510_1955 family glycosylhydrolase [Pseudarthrobacter siccitolerans]
MPLPFIRRRPAAGISTAIALLLTLSACIPSPTEAGSASSPAAPGLPSSLVYGLSVNRETDQVLLATHDGLFDVTRTPATKIGETNDLMGFTAARDQGVFYASGHPGPDSDLPNPVGLIKSVDGGKSWEQLSRQGESDFHAIAATKSGIVADDGKLQTSLDGKTWSPATAAFVPSVLAGTPESDTVLATTDDGVERSTDGGKTWELNSAAPLIQFVAFASATEAVGIGSDGSVHSSADAGITWTQTGHISAKVQAIAAVKKTGGALRIWAATTEGLVVSTDGGEVFRTPPTVR